MQRLPDDILMPADYQGWNWDNPIFSRLVDEVNPRTTIEVGTWKGMSAMNLHRAMARRCEPGWLLWCCDTWLGGIEHMEGEWYGGSCQRSHGYPTLYMQFLSNMQHAGCLENLHALPNTSLNCARWFTRRGIRAGLIYIDASHESPDVYNDAAAYWAILDAGGVMFGDDWGYPQVGHDITKFSEEIGVGLEIDCGNYWILRKNSA